MRRELLDLIVCPDCGKDLRVVEECTADGEIESGTLECSDGSHRFLIERFVRASSSSDDYADAFALEWNEFRTAHLDSYTGLTRLDAEFRSFLDFPIERLEGKLVLDAGCGLGRFSEIVLNYGGHVVAVDMSGAIDAARANLGARENIHFVQADVFRLPFRPETFDMAYSTGVLHHTPDPPAAFACLPPFVKPGGRVMTMVYAKYNKAYLATVEFYRKLTKRLPQRLLLKLSYVAVPLYYVSKIPAIGPFVTRILIPVSVHPPNHHWRVGNTFDLYSPEVRLLLRPRRGVPLVRERGPQPDTTCWPGCRCHLHRDQAPNRRRRLDVMPESVACNLCGSRDARLLYRQKDYRLAVDDTLWNLVICRRCGLGYLDPRPTVNEIGRYYPAHYYRHRRDAMPRYERQAAYVAGRPGRLLDVGTACGDFLARDGATWVEGGRDRARRMRRRPLSGWTSFTSASPRTAACPTSPST